MSTKVAVVLAGCGVFDGSETTEAASLLIALSQKNATVQVFAPDAPYAHVINHCEGVPSEGETRNILVESNRIARGNAKSLSCLKATDYDVLMIPGGFGIMKNLSNFAFATEDTPGKVDPYVASVIKDFHSAKKIIACTCIAPMLLAQTLGTEVGGTGCKITLGAMSGPDEVYEGTAATAAKAGNNVVACPVDGVIIDKENKIVTTPAYMYDATPAQVFAGISKCVTEALEL